MQCNAMQCNAMQCNAMQRKSPRVKTLTGGKATRRTTISGVEGRAVNYPWEARTGWTWPRPGLSQENPPVGCFMAAKKNNKFVQELVGVRSKGRNTLQAREQCSPESFCTSGKILRLEPIFNQLPYIWELFAWFSGMSLVLANGRLQNKLHEIGDIYIYRLTDIATLWKNRPRANSLKSLKCLGFFLLN